MAKELKDYTKEELFPHVRMQNFADVKMLDCTIDVEDKEMPIELEELRSELNRFYLMDRHLVCVKLIKHFDECLKNELVTNFEGETLPADSADVKEFTESELYRQINRNEALRLDFYTKLQSIVAAEGGWTQYYDEPSRRMYYKYTEGEPIMECVTDCIIEYPISKVVCIMAEPEIMMDFTPELKKLEYLKRNSDFNGNLVGDMVMPWPMYPRKMLIDFTVCQDYENKGMVSLCSGNKPGDSYFGTKIPDVDTETYVVQDTKSLYHFFQYIGPGITRHMTLQKSDPKFDYIPDSLFNWMLSTVLYQFMVNAQKYPAHLSDPEYKTYHVYQEKKEKWEYTEKQIFDQELPFVRISDCPGHVSNKNHPNHDPNDNYCWKE